MKLRDKIFYNWLPEVIAKLLMTALLALATGAAFWACRWMLGVVGVI